MASKKIEIKENVPEKSWRSFIDKADKNTFLQSYGWSKFQESQGNEVVNIGLYTGKVLLGICTYYITTAKRGTFVSIPHGPIIDLDKLKKQGVSKQRALKTIVEHFKAQGKNAGANCLRLAPVYTKTGDDFKEGDYTKLGFKSAPMHLSAETTTILDLTQTEKELLAGMRRTTRQMCKRGSRMVKKEEVQLEWVTEITEEMMEVYNSTTERGGFVSYPQKYLTGEYETMNEHEKCKMLVVRHEGRILSWGLWIIVGKRCFYHQGANILDKKIPASYISHWEGIKMAKEEGCESYDFFGVMPKHLEEHPWKNVSMFKNGFGGQYTELIHAMDMPLSWKYYPMLAIDKYRQIKRGYKY